MALKISSSSLLKYHYLIVTKKGIKFSETFGFSSVRKFSFSQIATVLMSPDHTLSFQVGEEVFSIPTKPRNDKHQKVIAALLEGVRTTDPAAARPSAAQPAATGA